MFFGMIGLSVLDFFFILGFLLVDFLFFLIVLEFLSILLGGFVE